MTNFLTKSRENSILKILGTLKKIRKELESIISVLAIIQKNYIDPFQKKNSVLPNTIDSLFVELKTKKTTLQILKKSIVIICLVSEDRDTPKVNSFTNVSIFDIQLRSLNPIEQYIDENQDWLKIGKELSNLITEYIYLIEQIEQFLDQFESQEILSKKPVIEYRRTRLIPRSISRTIERFFDELTLLAEDRYLQEFQFSRQQILISAKSLVIFLILPIITTQILKSCVLEPMISYNWNKYNSDFFLNYQQEQKALKELKDFEDQIYFEQLVQFFDNSTALVGKSSTVSLDPDIFATTDASEVSQNKKIESQMLSIAKKYNDQSIALICNILGDVSTFVILAGLVSVFRREISILKGFFSEILYSLGDTTKAFFIIVLTDLLVGFHSPKGWEIFIQSILQHLAIPQNEDFVFLCVATFPVLLDTAFKYWIFRYLNRLSPSTVVTYHKMIE